jgi:hypothetical protein
MRVLTKKLFFVQICVGATTVKDNKLARFIGLLRDQQEFREWRQSNRSVSYSAEFARRGHGSPGRRADDRISVGSGDGWVVFVVKFFRVRGAVRCAIRHALHSLVFRSLLSLRIVGVANRGRGFGLEPFARRLRDSLSHDSIALQMFSMQPDSAQDAPAQLWRQQEGWGTRIRPLN